MLIIALDFEQASEALAFAEPLNPQDCALKVGNELFTRGGPTVVSKLVAQGFRVFLDLKFHDIPNTVAKACAACADLGVWMLNVHAAGGPAMLQAARAALQGFGANRPLLIAVTVLTSLQQDDLRACGVDRPLLEQALGLASLAHRAGLDGVVCSALEAPTIKAVCGSEFLTVTPGIRLPGDALQDQVRVMTPQRAREFGSDHLVVGRSITAAKDPAEAIR